MQEEDNQGLHHAKCQDVFSTLLSMQIFHKAMPQAFVRELFHETARCDNVILDLSYQVKSEALANIIGTQAGSGPPFYLPARLATIENRLQKVETTQDHHTECFKALLDHFKIPFPAPPPPAASPAACSAARRVW